MQPDHQAILDQYSAYAQACQDVECAERHAERYREQYQQGLEQNRQHQEYLDNVVLGTVKAFEARAEELREAGDG